jgi:cobalt-zinc-cadmium efflux system membrane fusion protein
VDRVVATKDYLKAESDFKSKYAQVEGFRAQLDLLHLNPLKAEEGQIQQEVQIVSPLNGFVSRQDLVLGQYLEPHETPMEVLDPGQFRLSLMVYESSVSELETGQRILFSTPDRPQLQYQAVLSHIGISIDPVKRTIQCYGEIVPEYRGLFIENTFVEAEITTCQRQAISVPEDALLREGGSDFVLVLTDESNESLAFRKIPVRTGVTQNGYAELLDESLTNILISGAYQLSSLE